MYKNRNIVAAVILTGLMLSTTSRATYETKTDKTVAAVGWTLWVTSFVHAVWPEKTRPIGPRYDSNWAPTVKPIKYEFPAYPEKAAPVKLSALDKLRDGISNFMNRMFPTKTLTPKLTPVEQQKPARAMTELFKPINR